MREREKERGRERVREGERERRERENKRERERGYGVPWIDFKIIRFIKNFGHQFSEAMEVTAA